MKKIILISLSILFLITLVYAQVNLKTYDVNTKTISIKDDLNKPLANLELVYNTKSCSDDCFAVIKVNAKKGIINPFSDLIFDDMKNSGKKSLSYKLEVRKKGEKFKPYNNKEVLDGEYYIKIKGSKAWADVVDWKPTLFDILIDEWAIWGNVYTYDNLSSSVVNTTYWVNWTAGAGSTSNIISQSPNKNISMYGYTSTGSTIRQNINTTIFPSYNTINNFTIAVSEYGMGGPSYNEFYVFGNQIFKDEGANSYNLWTFKANDSSGFQFDVLKNNVYQKTISPINSIIGFYNFVYHPSNPHVSVITFSSINYTYINESIDVEIESPINKFWGVYNEEIFFNITSGLAINQLKNITLYIDGTLNETKLITGINNFTSFNRTFNVNKNYEWYVKVCDDDGNCQSTSPRTLTIGLIKLNSVTYNLTTYSGSNEYFILNVTYPNITLYDITGILNYNNTNYSSSKIINGNNIIFISNITIPKISAETIKSFYWNIALTNSTGTMYYTTSIYNQTIKKGTNLSLGITCPVGYSPAFNFTSYLETNTTNLYNISINYNIQYGLIGTPTANVLNGTLNNINSFLLCINNSQDYYYVGYGEIQYVGLDSVNRRYYIFQNTRINNITTNIPIYNLNTSDATAFLLTAQTTTLQPYSNYYIGLLRWYPEFNSYKVVEIGKTDDDGQTILNVKTESVDYRLGLYKPDGTLIKLFEPIRFICQTSPCTYSLFIEPSALNLKSYTSIQGNLSFDRVNKVFTFIWNDPSQTSQTMNLSVYKGDNIVCSSSSSGYTGILVCDVSTQTGLLIAKVRRTASPSLVFKQLSAEIRTTLISAGGGSLGLFIGALLLIVFALIGIYNPIIAVILTLIAIIPMFLLGIVTWEIMTAIGVIGGIIIHFIKRTT